MEYVSFSINCSRMEWINGSRDDPEDLCSHGHVAVQAGEETLSYDCCTSASALRMLRSLTQDHQMEDPMLGEQMLPCCGFQMYPDETQEHVWISGCCHGVDYGVSHRTDGIIITTQTGGCYRVRREEYRREVLAFARRVEAFYAGCTPKELPEDVLERNGWFAFWNEWHSLLKEAGGES